MAPQKDYDDYSAYINDAYKDTKEDLVLRASHSFERERMKTARQSHRVNPYSNFTISQTAGTVASSFDAGTSLTARER